MSFVNQTQKIDPASGSDLQNIFASVDVTSAVEIEIRPAGLEITNLPDAFTTYWITAYDASRGVSRDLTRDIVGPVQRQAMSAFLATPEFVSATDAQKQELAEAYLVQAALIGAYVEATESDVGQLENVKIAVKQGAKASGLDLDMMVLTDEGFSLR